MTRATFVSRRHEVADIHTFFFRPERPLYYIAGQYAEVIFDHNSPDGGYGRHWFTLSSSPNDALLAVTLRLPTKGLSVYKQRLSSLAVGDEVDISEPLGDFVLPKFAGTPLLFVASGIGITPYLSMLRWLEHTGEHRPIELLHFASRPKSFAFTEFLQAQPIAYQQILTNKAHAGNWSGESGTLTTERILAAIADNPDKLTYLSGPQYLIEPLYDNLQLRGIPREQLLLDYFPGYNNQ